MFQPDLINNSSSLLYQGFCMIKAHFKLLLCINIIYSMSDHCQGTGGVLLKQAATSRGVKWHQNRSLTHISFIPCRCCPFILGVLKLSWCRMRKLLNFLKPSEILQVLEFDALKLVIMSRAWDEVSQYCNTDLYSCEKLNIGFTLHLH